MSSSPPLSDSEVLHAFTAAYNNKFKELLTAASPSTAPTPCSVCSGAASKPAVVEVIEVTSPSPPKKGNWSAFGIVMVVFLILGVLFVFGVSCMGGGQSAPRRAGDIFLAGNALSVEASMNKTESNDGMTLKGVQTITNPGEVIPSGSGRAVVMYYADWCGHCKQMKPHFESLSKEFASVMKFFMCEHKMLEKSEKSSSLKIQGYPTTMVFDSGSLKGQLVGGVSADKLKEFIQQHSK